MNPASVPRVRLNESYAGMIDARAPATPCCAPSCRRRAGCCAASRSAMTRCCKVARSIVERQAAFLEHGEEPMRPMILRDIAEAMQMHESTVSRVTTGKYMHTPRGVFELRYFFSSQVRGRRRLRHVVHGDPREDPQADRARKPPAQPLSATAASPNCCPRKASRSRAARSPSTAKPWASRRPTSASGPARSSHEQRRHHAVEAHRPPRRNHALAARLRREEAGARGAALRPGHRRALRADRREAASTRPRRPCTSAAAASMPMRSTATCMPPSTRWPTSSTAAWSSTRKS